MADNDATALLEYLNLMQDTIARLQARLDATESLAICVFAQLPKSDQDSVIEAFLDRKEAIADAQIPPVHLDTYRDASLKLEASLLTKRRGR